MVGVKIKGRRGRREEGNKKGWKEEKENKIKERRKGNDAHIAED
jgi:hypothetical protein